MRRLSHSETHTVHRIGWLRAAVLGANDGIVSTSSLVVGVAAAGSGRTEVLIAGLAGLVASAMSMAAGEYVSVSSQSDAERADLARETTELAKMPEAELEELTQIYVARGLTRDLAERVAVQLTGHDALAAHARDELGISETITTRPIQAAIVSALTFAAGAIVPIVVAVLSPPTQIAVLVAIATLLTLVVLGALGASAGAAGGRPRVGPGRTCDRGAWRSAGPRGGGILLALGLGLLASARGLPAYLISWAVIGAGMGAGLHDAAFATLGRLYGLGARRDHHADALGRLRQHHLLAALGLARRRVGMARALPTPARIWSSSCRSFSSGSAPRHRRRGPTRPNGARAGACRVVGACSRACWR